MSSFKDNSDKGNVLMQQALKKYAEGDYEGGDKDRAEANKYFDLASKEINSEEGQLNQLYGESRNFGIIYNVFEQNIDRLLAKNGGKKVVKEVYDTIKNDKLLSKQFKLYDLFEHCNKVSDIDDFVNESTKLIESVGKNAVKTANDKIIKIIRENMLDEYVYISESLENLYGAVEYMLTNKKTTNNINEFVNAKNVIKEYVTNEQKKFINEGSETLTTDDFIAEVEEVDKKLSTELTKEEKELLGKFGNDSVDKKALFNKIKSDTLKKLDKVIGDTEGEEKEEWGHVYDKISTKEYSDEMDKNIEHCSEMLEICDTIDN